MLVEPRTSRFSRNPEGNTSEVQEILNTGSPVFGIEHILQNN